MAPKIKYSCRAPFCRNKYVYPEEGFSNKSFFRFPVIDIARCLIWVNFCNLNDTWNDDTTLYKNYFLCSDHFEEKYFTSTVKNRLLKTAIPSLKSLHVTTSASLSVSLSLIKVYSKCIGTYVLKFY